MAKNLVLQGHLTVKDLSDFVFQRELFNEVSVDENLQKKIEYSFKSLKSWIDKGTPIYGVTTGFGDNATSYVEPDHADQLQKNLINYLSCGQGRTIPTEASRAMFLVRLNSLAQGVSAVSPELIARMCLLLENDILPVVPCEGSLGASGDLVPLAYLGQTVQGLGEVFYKGEKKSAADVLKKLNITPYKLKPKEGLAIVNGTSTMAGMVLYNLKLTDFVVELCEVAAAWQCLLLGGRKEAFGAFINEVAKTNPGQGESAKNIRVLLDAENYNPARGQEVSVVKNKTSEFVQDPYSMRCVPQILGPIRENLKHSWSSLEHEINSVTDNPVVNFEGGLEMGGNFYGGYLCQAMDFVKINLAHIADLADRQLLMLVSEKFNRGLPANLIDIKSIPQGEQHMHHGLKGLHQTVGAITSEVIQRSIPSGIFSRSSESHNQDKVSLGMSASMTCLDMLEGVYKILAMQLVCLAQALDLKDVQLQGEQSQKVYHMVRSQVAFVNYDRSLGQEIFNLTQEMQRQALRN
ncbi:aromatic amino acid ammonia-lyase [Bdellovibrio sp. SKB1291214]|uniref:HAL/PAL/TAL family ammonia-lyase n=1 Tax=Bdellovibrio sp. SKB1291214 TaxID=1732569 RepID=UPI000B51925C|nr:aromatic amino acid ammonia-lyase [Bdellovibrio sp. SKB1291214]UYL09617.1 aromatic amino acid ammonia-lyase [Bdellovibrio sp. SKB1291214]